MGGGVIVPLLWLALAAPVLKSVLDGNVTGSAAVTRLVLATALAWLAPRLIAGLAGGYRHGAEVPEVVEAPVADGGGDGTDDPTADGASRRRRTEDLTAP